MNHCRGRDLPTASPHLGWKVPPLTDQTDGAGAGRSHGNVRPQDGADAVVTICSLCAAPRKSMDNKFCRWITSFFHRMEEKESTGICHHAVDRLSGISHSCHDPMRNLARNR
jgi:hypothetical protein